MSSFLRTDEGIKPINYSKSRNSKITREHAKILSEILKVNTTLEHPKTEAKDREETISDTGAIVISELLKTNKTFKLELRYIGNKGAEGIKEALKVNKTLKVLDLRNNRIRDKGAKLLEKL